MKLAVSNIGWAPEKRSEVLPQLKNRSIEGLVIAPTMVWPEAPQVTALQAKDFRAEVMDAGLAIAGMQSLTFGLKEGALSGDYRERRNLVEHLKRQAVLAGRLGAVSMIFGSPGLRKQVNAEQAQEVLAEAAAVAADNGTVLAIEPLSGYGNNFIQTTNEGVDLVWAVRARGNGHGFGLHLDAAAIAGMGEQKKDRQIRLDFMRVHDDVGIVSFDASAAELKPLTQDPTVPHKTYASALASACFEGYVSLEMRQPADTADPVAAFLKEVDYMREQYLHPY
jgi:sugar phosphate isomerase/epimerase